MRRNSIFSMLRIVILSVGLLFSSGVGSAFGLGEVHEANQFLDGYGTHGGNGYVQGEMIVKFKGENWFQKVSIPRFQDVQATLLQYRSRPDVEYAEPNYIAKASLVPDDTYYSLQWHFSNGVYGGIHTEPAWDVSSGTGVVVAVVDTGVAYEDYQNGLQKYYLAPDLANTCFVGGYDFVENDTHANDDNSHGTHVAGTVAQSTNNGKGVAGVAFSSCIMPVKVLDKNGSGTYANVADGIRFAADNGAKVINLSLGGPSPASYLEEALAYAYGKGVTIVAAAGNDGTNTISYPAAYDSYAVAVGATRYDETRAFYSNYGTNLDIMGPGGDLNVDQNGDGYADGVLQNTFNPNTKNRADLGYWFFQGTSMATPHVAGVAAMVISKGNATTPTQVRQALEQSAEDLGASGRDDIYGYGLVNAQAALAWTPGPPPPPETVVWMDSFEGGLGNWTQDAQNDWFQSTQRAVDGIYSAEVDGYASNAALISSPIDLQGKTNAKITFSWYIESSLDKGEYIALDVSTDGGATWNEKGRLRGNVDQENKWHNKSIELNSIPNLRLRFRGKMSGAEEDANVDLIKVTAW